MASSPLVTENGPPKNREAWTLFFDFMPGDLKKHAHWLFFFFLCVLFALHPFGDFYHLEGDNICQVTYFKILLNPHLAGSVGASAVKPGVVLLLGGVHAISEIILGNAFLVWLLLVVLASALTWLVMQWTAFLAGQKAAWAALGLLFCTGFPLHFMRGTSQLFFLPILLAGLFFMARSRPFWGIAFLLMGGLFRAEGFFVGFCLLGLSMRQQSISPKERNQLLGLLMGLVCIFVGITALAQGGLHRFAGGSSVGYTLGTTLWQSSPGDGVQLVVDILTRDPVVAFFLLPALWFLWKEKKSRPLGFMFLIPVFLLLYKSAFSANLVPRYFAFLIPFSLSAGTAGLFMLSGKVFLNKPRQHRLISSLMASAFIAAGATSTYGEAGQYDFDTMSNPFTDDGRLAARSPLIPQGMRVLVDDSLLSVWLIEDHMHFKNALAIQAFTQKDLKTQGNEMVSFDYIYLSTLKENRPFTYFNFIPQNRKEADPLRQKIIHTLSTGEPSMFGNVQLHRFHLDEARGILKVVKKKIPSAP